MFVSSDAYIPNGEFDLINNVIGDGIQKEKDIGLSTLAFDTHEELLWMGTKSGHVSARLAFRLSCVDSLVPVVVVAGDVVLRNAFAEVHVVPSAPRGRGAQHPHAGQRHPHPDQHLPQVADAKGHPHLHPHLRKLVRDQLLATAPS